MKLKKKVLFTIFIFILVSLMLFFLYHNKERIAKILVPFFMAIIITYLLRPIVLRLESKNIKRTTSILIIYLGLIIVILLTVIFVIPEFITNLKELINSIPVISDKIKGWVNGVFNFIQSTNWPEDIKEPIFEETHEGILALQNYMIDSLKRYLAKFARTLTASFNLIISMVIAYYFIKDAKYFKNMLLSLVPSKWKNDIVITGREVNKILSSFIQGQLVTALIVGILETIALYIIGVKYALVLGFIGGVANIIPFFGPILGSIPAIAIAFVQSPIKALWVVGVFFVIQQLDNCYISPKIIEGKLGIHPVTTIFVVLLGGEFFGILGMLIAVPIAAILKVIFKKCVETIV